MAHSKPAHFVVVPLAAWGHVRPLLHLVLNLVSIHPTLRVTLLCTPSISIKIKSELNSAVLEHLHAPASSGVAAVTDRVQIIDVKSPDLQAIGFSGETMLQEAMDYAKLFQSFVPDVIPAMLAANNLPNIPLIGFCASSAAATLQYIALASRGQDRADEIRSHFAKEENGGFIALAQRLAEQDIANGEDRMTAYAKHTFACTGEVVRIPGLPPMYDYEYVPMGGAIPFPAPLLIQVGGMRLAAVHPATVAVLCTMPAELEPDAKKLFEEDLRKPLLMAGIQFPAPMWDGMKPPRAMSTEDNIRVTEFLDSMEKKHGAGSVLYISFGSQFYPSLRPELVNYLIVTLLENDVPFLFAHASSVAVIPDELAKAIEAAPNGCKVRFAPQWAVLEHPAVGFFLSHCGCNSVAEAIMSVQPLIAVPFAADQGEFAMMLSLRGVAITLDQVKTFKTNSSDKTTKKTYAGVEIIGTEEAIKAEFTAVLKRIRGEEGDVMRKKMGDLKALHEQSYREGESRKTMEGMARYF
ncbi:hypothetical protein P7C73_g46, partial [Tremellales sp. Uapishka_1]